MKWLLILNFATTQKIEYMDDEYEIGLGKIGGRMNKIEVNDIVNVQFTRDDLFTSKRMESCVLQECKVKWVPCDVGDSYTFLTKGGHLLTVNPNCSAFVGLELVEKEGEQNDVR